MQQGLIVAVPGVRICPILDEDPGNLLSSRLIHWSPVGMVPGIYIGSALEEHTGSCWLSVHRCTMQWHVVFPVQGVHICVVIQEHVNKFHFSDGRRFI